MLQFILEFQLEKPQMPLEFDRLMVSFLKGASRNYSEDMFERLYDKNKSVIKTYTYSMYLPGARFMKETVELSENRFRMFFSDADMGQMVHWFSYLHEPGVRRYSLCLDLSEVFKPLIGDRLIFSLLNRKQITKDSFTKELNYLHLKKDASKLIVSEFENKMKHTIMHKELGKQVSYQYLMRLEAYKLTKHLLGEKEYEGFRIWW